MGSCGGEGVDDGDDEDDEDEVVENICRGCLLLLMFVGVTVVVEGKAKLLMSFEVIACGDDGDKLPPRLEVSSWYSICKRVIVFSVLSYFRMKGNKLLNKQREKEINSISVSWRENRVNVTIHSSLIDSLRAREQKMASLSFQNGNQSRENSINSLTT